MDTRATAEGQRLAGSLGHARDWKRWGPYLSERAWATVREDYSQQGNAWASFPHDHARSRAYRWNEDGIAGICDDQQRLCFALALWNEQDPILKERFFGLTGPEGNHGEDVKEYYYYLDSTPTHTSMKMLYKYPQRAFPYLDLVETNQKRGKHEPEYELLDTGIFDDDRYFDIVVEYAKATPDDILVCIIITNRGPDTAPLHVLPTLWFRNTWSWGGFHDDGAPPRLYLAEEGNAIIAEHRTLGTYQLHCEGKPELLFTNNNTNIQRLYNVPNAVPYVKDSIDQAVVHGRTNAVNSRQQGTKAATHYRMELERGKTATIRLRLSAQHEFDNSPWDGFDAIFEQRRAETNAFYAALQPATLSEDERLVQRQAFAGMLWSKQFYHYNVDLWLQGDPGQPSPPRERRFGRNSEWRHVNAAEIISMPDTWEYPWFAAWDLAFHCIPFALIDAEFAKDQLIMLGREWFQHPNGEIPAYEWAFGDVNPPVLAWAAWRVYKIDQKEKGTGDRQFLERVFHKLLLNFTWWVNRKDPDGHNIFQGGFLGLDNIGVFDRSAPVPNGGHIEQSDGTSWMGMFCLNMLTIAGELACYNPVYEDIASKFFEHFLYIAEALHNIGGEGIALWNDEDEFFYDVLHSGSGVNVQLRVRSMVGLIPLFAVTTIEPVLLERLPAFRERLEVFLAQHPELAGLISRWYEPGAGERRLLALLRGHRMKRVLRRMLDETEFLAPYGVRALSRYHAEHPYVFGLDGEHYVVDYQPAEATGSLFGGNSNWRGPIWVPLNFLIIEALQQFHHYYSDDFKVECPTGSGHLLTLAEIADELSERLIRLFVRDEHGRRPIFGDLQRFQHDPQWRDYLLFHEYFNGDDGSGLGASHQTGWTGLVAKLLQQQGEFRHAATPDADEDRRTASSRA